LCRTSTRNLNELKKKTVRFEPEGGEKKSEPGEEETAEKDEEDEDEGIPFEEQEAPSGSEGQDMRFASAPLSSNSHDERMLLSQFTPEQSNRFEYYRRSSFQRGNIKKVKQSILRIFRTQCIPLQLMQNVAGVPPINQKMAIVMSGITKVFVGELVETGLVPLLIPSI
jgi:transcription initiation factor TFIID subunit 11